MHAKLAIFVKFPNSDYFCMIIFTLSLCIMKKNFLIPMLALALTACGGTTENKETDKEKEKSAETDKAKDKPDAEKEKEQKKVAEEDKKLPPKPVETKVDDDVSEPEKK